MTSLPDVAPSSTRAVTLAVLGSNPDEVAACLEAASREEIAASFVVGGGAKTRRSAEAGGASWLPNLPALQGELGSDATHVWLLHADCRPRPGALSALIREAERTDASVAGSKVLRAADPGELESVGGATDVFGHPYSGLSEGELDQEQYDVVRDVAFIPVVSVLIRRDLLKGIGGPDLLLAPVAQGIDLAQRARLLGGRVVVVPSSEVVHEGNCAEGIPPWRERAGELRAVAKAYSTLTLSWVLPFSLAIGLMAALVRTVLGRPNALLGELKAWMWNAKNLGSTLRGRRAATKARSIGDEELFRYQSSGSEMARQVGEELTTWVRERSHPEGALGALIARRRGFWHEPGFVATIAAVVVAAIALRATWLDGMPLTGFRLEPSSDWRAVLANYAGGWNPSGLGWVEPLRPAVGLLALTTAVGLSSTVVSFGSMVLAFTGMSRLMRTLRADDVSRISGAFALAFGPPLFGIAEVGHWPAFLAVGLVPWAVDAAVRPLVGSLRMRVGRVGAAVFVTGLMTVLVPWLAVLPLLTLLILSAMRGEGWRSVARAGVYGAVSLGFAVPWLWWAPAASLLRSGEPLWWQLDARWAIGWAIATLGSLAIGSVDRLRLIGPGALIALGGTILSRAQYGGVGLELAVAGMVAAHLGFAIAAGATIGLWTSDDGFARRGLAKLLAALMVVLLLAGSGTALLSGRGGFGADRFGAPLAFPGPRAGSHGPDRVLVVGGDGPGESRVVDGVPYRVISGGVPLTEAWLPVRQAGDAALEQALRSMTDPQVQRAGAELARFGIRWVAVLEPNALQPAFEAKLDLRRLELFETGYAVYENLESSPRAVRDDGTIWRHEGFEYSGQPQAGSTVLIAEQFHPRWRPSAVEEGWSVRVDASSGRADVAIDPTLRALAVGAAVLAALSAAAAVSGLFAPKR